MKPIKLIMQAFGPFASKESVDFTKLGENPLFLINGPTGSGKTSILDAICFALYGETTSNERLGAQMRCDQAKSDVATEVSFDFELGNKRYRVTRSPEQEVPKSRGDGFTTRKHTASLYQLDEDQERLITAKTVQVKGEVSELIGLNETQFRQVMVLPQGKFRELLLASSKEREAIFGQLFQTDMYKKIEFALKEKASSISKAKNDFDNQIRGALKVADSHSEEELNEHFTTASQIYTEAKQQESELLKKLTASEKELQSATNTDKQYAQLTNANAALDAHLTALPAHTTQQGRLALALQASRLTLSYTRWQQSDTQCLDLKQQIALLTSQVAETEKELVHLQQALDKSEQDAQSLPGLATKKFELEQSKTKWLEKVELERRIKDEQGELRQLEEKLEQYQRHKQKLSSDADTSEQMLQQARKQLEERPRLEVERINLERVVTDLTRRDELLKQLKELKVEEEKRRSLAEKAYTIYQDHVRIADTLEMRWHGAQAAILAQKLSPGDACPVCGSVEHPSPAQLSHDDVSKPQVDQARKRERELLADYNQCHSGLLNQQTVISQHVEQINRAENELGDRVSDRVEVTQQQLELISTQLAQLSQLDIAHLESKVVELKQRCETGESKIVEVKQQISAKRSSVVLLDQQLSKLVQQFTGSQHTFETIDKQLHETTQLIEALNKALEESKKHFQATQLVLREVEGQLKSTQGLFAKESENLEQVTMLWQQELDSSDFNSQDHFLESKLEQQEIEQLKRNVDDFEQTKLKLSQTISDLKLAVKDIEKPDLQAIEANLQQRKLDYQASRDRLDSSSALFERLDKAKKQINELHDKNAELEKEYQVFGTLYDVASGKTGSRISLHRFVLGVLLDDVLIQASHRLNLMSKGRYLLKTQDGRL